MGHRVQPQLKTCLLAFLVKGMESTVLLNQETATEKIIVFFKLSEHTEETRPHSNLAHMHNYPFPQLR